MMKIEHINDPGHGWLKVPLALIGELDLTASISRYSYVHDGFAYLEHDCDAAVFIKAMRERGVEIFLHFSHTSSLSRIRKYRRFGVAS